MSLTHREPNRFFLPLGLWGVLTLVATLSGPFGTFEQLTVFPRAIYWAGMIALAIAGDFGIRAAWPVATVRGQLVRRVTYIFLYCLILYAVNSMIFEGWYGVGFLLYGFGLVAGIGVAIEVLVSLVFKALHQSTNIQDAGSVSDDTGPPEFLHRLPYDKRGALIRIEAQDHYLNVVTDKGAELVLMRMSDAERELGDGLGLRVHRSHWVATAAIQTTRREKGRLLLVMSDNTEVSVSRSYLAAVKAAGFSPQ